MREREYRRLLAGRLGAESINSYVANCRRVERDLAINLDNVDLSDAGIAALVSRLRGAGVHEKSVNNCRSALRAYAELGTSCRAAPSAPPAARGPMTITREQRESWSAGTASSPFNSWLADRVRDAQGQLDLDRLHDLAAEYGVDRRQEYRNLNPGQQRMSLGNILRRLVPKSVYDGHSPAAPSPSAESQQAQVGALSPEGQQITLPDRKAPALEDEAPRRESVRQASVGELLGLYGEIMDELRVRSVVRTGNSPVGDYAELLFAEAFGWSLEGNSAFGHDATDARGLRYQIKGRRLSSLAASRQLGAIRRLPDHTFDYLAAVLFDPRFKVLRAAIIPHEIVVARARRTDHTNSWTFLLDDRIWGEKGVRDVTADLAVAASRL